MYGLLTLNRNEFRGLIRFTVFVGDTAEESYRPRIYERVSLRSERHKEREWYSTVGSSSSSIEEPY